MARRSAGISSLQRHLDTAENWHTLGASLAAQQTASLSSQLATFQQALSRFSSQHRQQILSSPSFRTHFSQLCNELGVDPLGGGAKGLWDKIGVGDWYYALGVQVVDVCLAKRERGGGLVALDEVLHGVERLRSAGGKAAPGSTSQVTEQDIHRAIDALEPLGCGYVYAHLAPAYPSPRRTRPSAARAATPRHASRPSPALWNSYRWTGALICELFCVVQMGFPKFNNRRDAISTEDLPTVDIGFQVNLQPFQHETVAKIEWNAFAHASKQRKDYTINSSILTSLMDLDNATAAIDPHESLLLTHLRVTCKRFLDRSLAPSDQFMHGIRHLLLKAHGLPLAGAMDVLHEKLQSFAEFVVAEAKESGAPIGKREGKLVDEQVERSKNANYRELRDEGLEKARKCLILYSEMMNRAPQALCEDAVKQCLVVPLFDPEHSNQKFSQDFFFLAYIIADMLDKQMGMVGEWLPQFLVTGTRNPSSKKKTSFNFESVQTAEWWAQIFAATGLNDEDQELVLSWQKFKKPAYRFLWAFAAVAGVYPGTNGGFVNICKGYFTGDSPNRAIDKILPRHQWTTRDEQAIVGHALNMYKADYGSSNKLEAQNKDGVVVEPKEEGEEQQTLQISRLDLRDLLCRLMFAEAVNEYGQPVSYKLSEMRKITKIALQTHITVEAPLLARLALSVGLPLGFLFTAAKTAELKEAGIHDGMAEKDVDKAISAYRDLLRVEQLEKQKVRRRERGQVGSDDDSGSTSSDEAEE